MSLKLDSVDVVDLCGSSNDDEAHTGGRGNRKLLHSRVGPTPVEPPRSFGKASSAPTIPASAAASAGPTTHFRRDESRSFWKAGNYEVGPTNPPSSLQDQLEHARIHPKFLHSNATSHRWAFGAIAELLDNAVDEICNGATFVKVDKVEIMNNNSPALQFLDDGSGMDPDGLRKCMSLGYSSKKANTTIGQYGNGFKTSTMRLGADAIVFTRATREKKATQSIGLLSYTFLCKTGEDDVIVPMVDFDNSTHGNEPIIYSSQEDWFNNLLTILKWSPFASNKELMLQFEDIGSHGTKVIIYNLWLNDEGIYELNLDDDDEDIRLRDEANCEILTKLNKKSVEIQSHISYRIRYSLRAYSSMLYLRKLTNFRIILRGKTVEQYNIADELEHRKRVIYKPQLSMAEKEVSVETTVGFIKGAPSLPISGFNVYHKNRLIKPFWKVQTNAKGNGVIGVLEANFIEPAHNKQDFEKSALFSRLENKLKQILSEYWHHNCHLIGHIKPNKTASKIPVGVVPDMKRQLSGGRHNLALSVDLQNDVNLEQTAVDLATASHVLGNVFHRGATQVNFQTESPIADPICQQAAGSTKEGASVNSFVFMSADQICDDNICLFARCEEHRLKESELKDTAKELEKELEKAKKKCAQLSAHMENQRKQAILMKQT